MAPASTRPVPWPVEPRDPATASVPNTNSVILVGGDSTNNPASTTPPVATPPATAPTQGSPDSIQSSPTLQGSAPDKGPI
jgi:hypothetical protein